MIRKLWQKIDIKCIIIRKTNEGCHMKPLDETQIRTVIENAIKAYEQSLLVRKDNGDPYVIEQLRSKLYDSCMNVSSLIHHILKKDYGVLDDDNVVATGLFVPPGSSGVSHTVNIVYGQIIDATIEQFNYRPKLGVGFTPYEINTDYYIGLEEVEPMNVTALEQELDSYETFKFIHERYQRQPKKKLDFKYALKDLIKKLR